MRLYDWQKILVAITKCILYPETKTVFLCENKESETKTMSLIQEQIKKVEDVIKLDNSNSIRFKNGSYIEVITPKKDDANSIIRGKRSSKFLPIDNDCLIDETIMSEVLKEFFKE